MAEYTILQVKRDSTLNWYASNPRLALGEPGVDMDLHRFKIGNGIDRWNELPYMDDDLYTLLSEQDQKTADKVQDLLNIIADNKLDADQKHNAVINEFRNTSRNLTERMTAVETGQAEYQENLTERQQEYEEAITGDFGDTKAEVQAGLDEFNQTRDQLTARMNVIAGQTTEDTEILDARVDAEYQAHPNLGENIRNIHSRLLGLAHGYVEDKATLDAEIADLKTADIQEQQIRSQTCEEHEARLSRLDDDAGKLFAQDTTLQEQTESNAEGLFRVALLMSEEMLRSREETSKREHENAELSARLTEEVNKREYEDSELSARLTVEGVMREDEDRELRSLVRTQTDDLRTADAEIDAKLENERSQRVIGDEELAERIDTFSEAVLGRTIEHIQEHKQEHEARERAEQELADRIEKDADNLQNEIARAKAQEDTISEAVIAEGLLLDEEHEKLRIEHAERLKAEEDLSRIHGRREEFLQEQTNENAEEIIGLNIRLYQERQDRLQGNRTHDAQIETLGERLENVRENLQTEIDRAKMQEGITAEAILGGAVEHIREHEEREKAEQELAEAIDRNNDRLSAEIDRAKTQEDTISEAVLGGVIEYVREHEERKKTEQELSDRIDENTDRIDKNKASLDERLHEEIQPVAEGLMLEGMNRYESESRLQSRLKHEETTRTLREDFQNEQIAEVSRANLANTLNIFYEFRKRQQLKQDTADYMKELEYSDQAEASIRRSNDAELQRQIEILAALKLREALDRYEEYIQAKADKQRNDAAIQENNQYQTDQINKLTEAVLREALDRCEEHLQAKADKEHTNAAIQELARYQTEQINDLVEAVFYVLINEYRAREKLTARIEGLENALVEAGVLDDSYIPATTDAEIEKMLEDIFAGNPPNEPITPDNEEEAEFLQDLYNIFNP